MIISPKPTSAAMSAYTSAVEAKSAAEAQKRKVNQDDSQQDKSPNDDVEGEAEFHMPIQPQHVVYLHLFSPRIHPLSSVIYS